MRWKLKYVIVPVIVLVALYVVFMLGRYSYLIVEPEFLLGDKDKWLVGKARDYALEAGITEERLKDPKVVDTVKVYFGGMAGMGGVEVTMMKENGLVLQMSY